MFGGFGGRSRQIDIRRQDEKTEHRLPMLQTGSLIVAGLLAISTMILLAILTGPIFGYVIISVLHVYFTIRAYVVFDKAGGLVVGVVLIAWLAFGYQLLDKVWIPVRFDLPGWILFIIYALSLPVFIGTSILLYRMTYEISDPNWPPPIEHRKPDAGPVFPGTRVGPQSQVIVTREVPRPFMIRQGGAPMIDEQDIAPDASVVGSLEGPEVRVQDAIAFVRLGPRIGTSSREWKRERGWEYSYWKSVVDFLVNVGILYPLTPKSSPKFAITDFNEAMIRITEGLT